MEQQGPTFRIFAAASDTGTEQSETRSAYAWRIRDKDWAPFAGGGLPLAGSTPGFHAGLELACAIEALRRLPPSCAAVLYTRQKYVRDLINEGPEKRHQRNYCKAGKKKGTPLVDARHWRMLDEILNDKAITLSATAPALGSEEDFELSRCKEDAAGDRRNIGRNPSERDI